MITKSLNLEISMITISWLLENKICIHLINIKKLQTRLKKKSKYPLRGLMWVSTCLDKHKISEDKRKELILSLKDVNKIL